MKALDTSAVLRFLTQDDEEKAKKVKEVIENEGVYIPGEVILECVFILTSKRHKYKKSRKEVIDLLLDFLTHPQVEVEDEIYLDVLELWKNAGKLSFVDVVIALKASGKGFELFSFDSKLVKWFENL
ncbi:MAG TPA: type II toxin-antitoxin system VapC family toxin [Aquifex aeolicus]|nr:type II toxin-antitoxin system VapC family toxin [Aquifex aeolicus]